MTRYNKIGWAIHGIAIGSMLLYAFAIVAINPERDGGLDGYGIAITAYMVTSIPVYIFTLLLITWKIRRRPPLQFLVGVVSYLVAVALFAATGDMLQDSFMGGLSWWAVIIGSFVLMQNEIGYLLMRAAD